MLLQRSAAGELFFSSCAKNRPAWEKKKKRLLLGAECSLPSLLMMFRLTVVNLNVVLSYLHFAGALLLRGDNLTTNRPAGFKSR